VNQWRLSDAKPKQFSPSNQKLLKKKGWTWPPDEKLRKQNRETIENSAGSLHTSSEVLKKVLRESGRFEE